ncbi:MAG: phosphate signaling complex protein PhoU [Lachnospiraceae bacterium]
MRERFEKQLEMLNQELIQMGTLIEQAIGMAVRALVNQDVEAAKEAIAFDEEIDRQEHEIEMLCMRLLLQQQPVAKDLRLVSAALKMITDMERIGDHAADISEITLQIAGTPYIADLDLIESMAKSTTDMVIKSVDAFVTKDLQLATVVISQDDVVDDLFDRMKERLIQKIDSKEEGGEQAIDLQMVAKYFERIGDHATNIAEWVIYSITGTHDVENQA